MILGHMNSLDKIVRFNILGRGTISWTYSIKNGYDWLDIYIPEFGIYLQAGASELKGRVIKKARRRNVGDEAAAPKNAFSSFSGFATAAKPSAEASFGFLADKKSEAPSFFGSDKKTESGPVFGSAKSSFALGGGGASETAKPVAPAFGGFSFGSKAEEKRDEPVKVNPLSPVNDNKELCL